LPAGGGLRYDKIGQRRHGRLQGMRFGLHCVQCCFGLMIMLLVIGVMDLRMMVVVAAAITAERLAPAGLRISQATGVLAVGAGLILIARAVF